MSEELMPAITLLQRRLEDAERNVNALRATLDFLRSEAGLGPSSPSGGAGPEGGGGGSVAVSLSQIKDDTFYGKRQQTAIREYLEMRKAAGAGPAKPREIYDALRAGGYEFEAKTDEIALVGLRALLRKRSHVFHKLPNGAYGMMAWYPHAKAPKVVTDPSRASSADGDDSDDDDVQTAAPLEAAAA